MSQPFDLRPERPGDAALADGLIVRAFGPGRYAKAAERLREGSSPVRELSLIAWKGERAVGCVRLWPITVGGTEALLLGPFAVEEAERSAGVGAELISRACQGAASAGHRVVLLVGDLAYFGPLGFSRTRDVRMPGPVDPSRVLACALVRGAADGLGGEVKVAREPRSAPLALAAE
jgi:predicted N-acetyltransferase YhbS